MHHNSNSQSLRPIFTLLYLKLFIKIEKFKWKTEKKSCPVQKILGSKLVISLNCIMIVKDGSGPVAWVGGWRGGIQFMGQCVTSCLCAGGFSRPV